MDYLRQHLPLKADPRQLLPTCQSVIVVGLNYNRPNPARPGQPKIARYALGRDYHKVLRKKLKQLETLIQNRDPNAECRACVDSAPILEREFAQMAGIGWFGKNTCLIDSHRGSWFFIGVLLTSVHLEPDQPAIGGCGTCRKCIDACPTGAIVLDDDRWQVDSRRCISYLTIEHRGDVGLDTAGWTVGCDICQEVCPFNEPRPSQPERGESTTEQDFLTTRVWPPLGQLANIQNEEWDQLTVGSAARRVKPDMLRRNARLNLASEETGECAIIETCGGPEQLDLRNRPAQ
jgi:epoxyqueuosine reductase